MLVQADVSKLELVVAAWLSQDPVMMQELISNIDLHNENQVAFNLPERRIAKILVFRIIYGGTEWSFAQDPDFNWISNSVGFWLNRIADFYKKYAGIKKWHDQIVADVVRTGQLVSPTGRVFSFRPTPNKWGKHHWPVTDIKNYPVQGTAADLVSIARVTAFKRLKELNDVQLVSTVHDSLVADCKKYQVERVARILLEEIEAVPRNFEKVFKSKIDPLGLTAEVKVGPTLGQLEKITL